MLSTANNLRACLATAPVWSCCKLLPINGVLVNKWTCNAYRDTIFRQNITATLNWSSFWTVPQTFFPWYHSRWAAMRRMFIRLTPRQQLLAQDNKYMDRMATTQGGNGTCKIWGVEIHPPCLQLLSTIHLHFHTHLWVFVSSLNSHPFQMDLLSFQDLSPYFQVVQQVPSMVVACASLG